MTKWVKKQPTCSTGEIRALESELEGILALPSTDLLRKQAESLGARIIQMKRRNEEYWAQRARVEWLRAGDMNPGFFHAMASQRRRTNRIHGLLDSRGNWRSDEEGIQLVIIDYFKELFKTNGPRNLEDCFDGWSKRLSEGKRRMLDRNFHRAEIEEALKQMQPAKAPGPDGCPQVFTSNIGTLLVRTLL